MASHEGGPEFEVAPRPRIHHEGRVIHGYLEVPDLSRGIHRRQRHPTVSGKPPQQLQQPVVCLRRQEGHASLHDARLLEGDLGQGVSEVVPMVHGDVGHGRDLGQNDIRSIESSTQPHLHYGLLHPFTSEGVKAQHRDRFEEREAEPKHGILDLLRVCEERSLRKRRATHPYPLPKGAQVRRREASRACTRLVEHGCERGGHRPLAVGPANVEDREGPMRIAQGVESTLGALQPPVHTGSQRGKEACDQRIGERPVQALRGERRVGARQGGAFPSGHIGHSGHTGG